MRHRIRQTIFLLALAAFCLDCSSDSKLSNSSSGLQFSGDKSNLTREVFEKLGYKVKSFGEGPSTQWHQGQFQTVWSRGYQVKSESSLKEAPDTFPRYTVVEEVYDSEDSAGQRLKRIQEKPPDLPIESREYWMVTGFQNKKNVYFIQTDAVIFDYGMEDFAHKLSDLVKKNL